MIRKVCIILFLVSCFCITFSQSEIYLKNYFRNLKSVEVQIAGKHYNFLFDTGGGMTIVSPAIIKDLSKSVYGNSVGFRMSGEKVEWKLCDSIDIKIGSDNFFHEYVGVFDIMSILPKEFEKVDGLISLKTFEKRCVSFNLYENKIIIETFESLKEKIKEMSLIPSRFADGPDGSELNIFIGVKAKNRLRWFLFDSGNISNTIVSDKIADEINLLPHGKESSENLTYKILIAGRSFSVPVRLDNIIYDGVFGFNFISKSQYLISFKDEMVWMGEIKK